MSDARERLVAEIAAWLDIGLGPSHANGPVARTLADALPTMADDLIECLVESGALVRDTDELSGEPIWREGGEPR